MRETSSSSAASAAASSASNNDTNNDSDPSPPPSVLAAAAASSSSVPISVSDLVPFVASVLRDRAMQDLQTEHDALQQELKRHQEAQLRVEITGRDGNPVYCQTSMKYGVTCDVEGTPYWEVSFDDNDDGTNITIPNFIEAVEGLELRLGDIVIFPFNTAKNFNAPAEHAGFDRTRDDTRQMANVGFHNDNGVQVVGQVGPILFEEYSSLFEPTMDVPGLVRVLTDHNNNNSDTDTVLVPQLEIFVVSFPESQITGILRLLNTMGSGEIFECKS